MINCHFGTSLTPPSLKQVISSLACQQQHPTNKWAEKLLSKLHNINITTTDDLLARIAPISTKILSNTGIPAFHKITIAGLQREATQLSHVTPSGELLPTVWIIADVQVASKEGHLWNSTNIILVLVETNY